MMCAALFSCSKDNINIIMGGGADKELVKDTTSSGNNGSGSSTDSKYLMTFVPYLLSNFQTYADTDYSPLSTGRYVNIYAYNGSTEYTKVNYVSKTIGTLAAVNDDPMYLPTGNYSLYAVGRNDQVNNIPSFTNLIATELSNAVDYVYWSSGTQSITGTKNFTMDMKHACVQIVLFIDTTATSSTNSSSSISSLNSVTITPSNTVGATWSLTSGNITSASSLSTMTASMGVSGLYAQYIMLPVKVSEPTTLPFSFSITLEGETNARTYNASIAIPSNELIAGNSYLFTVTFVNNEITFNSTVNIINWVEVSGGKPVVPIQTN